MGAGWLGGFSAMDSLHAHMRWRDVNRTTKPIAEVCPLRPHIIKCTHPYTDKQNLYKFLRLVFETC